MVRDAMSLVTCINCHIIRTIPIYSTNLHWSCYMKWWAPLMINIISDSAAVPSDWTGAHYCSWERVLRQDSRNARNQRWVVVNIYKNVLLCKVQKIQFQFLTNWFRFGHVPSIFHPSTLSSAHHALNAVLLSLTTPKRKMLVMANLGAVLQVI